MGLDRLNSLFRGGKDNIAGGVIQPLNPKVSITLEIVSDRLVRHVIDSMQVPRVLPYLHIVLREIDVILLIEVAF
jgi:hypothetical protein